MRSFQKLFAVLKSARKLLLISQFFSFLTIFFNIALLATSAWLISTAALHPPLAALTLAITGVRFYGISRALCRYIERYISHNMAFQGLYSLRTWLYSVIEPLAPAILRKYGSGDILGRIMADIEILQFFYLRVLIPPISALAITVAFGYFLGIFSAYLTIVLVIAAVVGGVLLPLIAMRFKGRVTQSLLVQRAETKNNIVEALSGMMDIMAYNYQGMIKASIISQCDEEDRYKEKIGQGDNLGNTIFVGLVQVTMLISLLLMAQTVLQDTWDGVYLAVIAIGVQAYFEALQPMNEAFYHCKESKMAMDRLVALSNEKPTVVEPKEPQTLNPNNRDPGVAPSITFKNMTFSYGNRNIFHNFNLHIKSGEHVAIVGPSGSGKTTLFSILERFYDYEGSILLNDVELKTLTQEESRSYMSIVNQQPYIFHATLEDNIRLAKPYAAETEVEAAIKSAQFNHFVDLTGLTTMVGGGGGQLSGGERQRVALARLFLHNRLIWLLDEPLEGLDQVLRSRVQSALLQGLSGKTALFITHQLQGLNQMDRIIFLENGTIKEEGSYESLMAKKGAFYNYISLAVTAV